MGSRVFFSTTIRGLVFEGVMSGDGPSIACTALNGGVALGSVCGLRKFSPDFPSGRTGPMGWWLVKYNDQARLDLTNFADAEAQELGDAFGIVPQDILPWEPVREDYFFTSRAWESLCDWVRAHPRLAKEYARHQVYLPGWYEKAIAALGPTT